MQIITSEYIVLNGLETGTNNSVSGLYASAFGQSNSVSGNISFAIGTSNSITGIRSFCVGETINITSDGSTALGFYHNIDGARGFATGQHNRVNSVNGSAFGFGCKVVRFSELAQATSYNGTGRDGGSQHSFLTAHKYTTTDTPIKMSLNYDDTAFIDLEDNTTYAFKVTIVARNTGAVENAVYELKFEAERASGVATTEVNGIVKTTIFEDVSAWDVTAQADTTNGRVDIIVTGEAGKTIHWSAKIEIVQVK